MKRVFHSSGQAQIFPGTYLICFLIYLFIFYLQHTKPRVFHLLFLCSTLVHASFSPSAVQFLCVFTSLNCHSIVIQATNHLNVIYLVTSVTIQWSGENARPLTGQYPPCFFPSSHGIIMKAVHYCIGQTHLFQELMFVTHLNLKWNPKQKSTFICLFLGWIKKTLRGKK